jgi:hypothetical protein
VLVLEYRPQYLKFLGPVVMNYYVRAFVYLIIFGISMFDVPTAIAGCCFFCSVVSYAVAGAKGERFTFTDPNAKRKR